MVLGILGESALVLSIVSFSLALNSATKSLFNKLNASFFGLCLLISAWAFTFALERYLQTGIYYKLHLILNLFLAPAGMYFLKILTQHQSTVTKVLYRFSLIYAAVVIYLIIFKEGYSKTVNTLANFGPTLLGLECFYLMSIRKVFNEELLGYSGLAMKSITGSASGRTWIYFGAIFLLFTAVMDQVPWVGETIPAIGNLLVCIYLFVISEVIIHQQLIDVSSLLNKLLMFVAIGVLSTVVFLIFTAWIQNSFGLFVLNSFFASIIVLLIFDPSREIFHWIAARVFNRRYMFFEKKIRLYIESLNDAASIKEMNQKILDLSQKVLNAKRVRIFIFKPDQNRFIRTMGIADDDLKALEISDDHIVNTYFFEMEKQTGSPVIFDKFVHSQFDRTTNESQLSKLQPIINLLSDLHCNVIFPLMVGTGKHRNILGMVAAQLSSPPNPWGDNWGFLPVSYPFFEKVALVLKNQDIFIHFREKDRLATIGEMSAGLAHEIRNPLSAIKGAAQYLKSSGKENNEAFLNIIEEEVNRLNDVVSKFLDYSKPYEINEKEIELGPYVSAVLERFKASVVSDEIYKQINFKISITNQLINLKPEKTKIKIDTDQIRHVLINFMQNAVDAFKNAKNSSEKIIVIGAHLLENNDISLYVEDNGPGIESENLEKLFIPFYTSSTKGTGLGLAICAKIIEAHGGKVEVMSKPGIKTRFTITLPSRRVQI